MPPPFDPYREWLDIPVAQQPPDHYRLLGVARFSTDENQMADAADRRMMRIGAFQSGEHADQARRILAEVAAAKLCLCNTNTRARYDAVLKADPQSASSPGAATATPTGTPAATASSPPAAAPMPPAVRRSHASAITGQWFMPLMIVGTLLLATLAGMIGLAWSVKHRPRNEPVADSPIGALPDIPEPPGSLLEPTDDTDDPPRDDVGVFAQARGGRIHCLAGLAMIHGDSPKIVRRADRPVIAEWTSRHDWLSWQFDVETPGIFRVDVTYASADTSAGGRFSLDAGGSRKAVEVRGTGRNDNFVTEEIGFLTVRKRGRQTLEMKVQSKPPGELMALESILLTPTLTGARPQPHSK